MSTVIELNNENFNTTISNKDVCVVRFWAPWCAPCRMVAPTFQQLSKEMSEHAQFAELNIDEAQQLAAKYGIRSIPTTLVYKNGIPVDSLVGAASLSQFKDFVSKNI